MHPYEALSNEHFWLRSVSGKSPGDIPYDPQPKFRFRLNEDAFATAGSCFAQHFGRELVARGGKLLVAETRHPLIPVDAGHGYGIFSARYGNIYSTKQLRDLVEQAYGVRPALFEFARREDGRWVDMLRPRAVPDGFSSESEARADRVYHLGRVRDLLAQCSVFVFTLGLTETWINTEHAFAYGLCPGVAAGSFDPALHEFRNLGFEECLADLRAVLELLAGVNHDAKVLLTVSPVMLVATMEARGVIQSSIASKSILRAVADECTRRYPFVDYFPSYEIVTGPQARGEMFDASGRDVSDAGVKLVMDTLFRSRVDGASNQALQPAAAESGEFTDWKSASNRVAAALGADCDEILLDRESNR